MTRGRRKISAHYATTRCRTPNCTNMVYVKLTYRPRVNGMTTVKQIRPCQACKAMPVSLSVSSKDLIPVILAFHELVNGET